MGVDIVCVLVVPSSLAITAESVFEMRPDGGNDTLFNVVMIYDNQYDRLSGGIQNFWNSPIQFLLWPDYWKKVCGVGGTTA
jgi:hypothetical protein